MPTYFEYNAVVIDMHKIPLWKRLGADEEAIYEPIRKEIVNCMRFGNTCVLSYKESEPKFPEYQADGMLEPNWLFHPVLREDKDNHMKIIRLEETIDNTGVFSLNPNFNLVVLASYENDEQMNEFVKHMPCRQCFNFYLVS